MFAREPTCTEWKLKAHKWEIAEVVAFVLIRPMSVIQQAEGIVVKALILGGRQILPTHILNVAFPQLNTDWCLHWSRLWAKMKQIESHRFIVCVSKVSSLFLSTETKTFCNHQPLISGFLFCSSPLWGHHSKQTYCFLFFLVNWPLMVTWPVANKCIHFFMITKVLFAYY